MKLRMESCDVPTCKYEEKRKKEIKKKEVEGRLGYTFSKFLE